MKKFAYAQISLFLLVSLCIPIQSGVSHAQNDLSSINFRNVEQLRVQVEALKKRVSQLEARPSPQSASDAKIKNLEASVRFLKLSLDLYIKKMNAHTHTYQSTRFEFRNVRARDHSSSVTNPKPLLCSYIFSKTIPEQRTSTPN